MSMLCSMYRLTAAQATGVQVHQEAAGELMGYTPPPPPKVGLLGRLFGKSVQDRTPSRAKQLPLGERETFDLGQAWHILHFLFSGNADGGLWPAAFLMSGGQEVGIDYGYGRPRLLSPEQLSDVVEFIDTRSLAALTASYTPENVEPAQVYWSMSDDPADRKQQVEELWRLVQDLRSFLGESIHAGNSALIQIY